MYKFVKLSTAKNFVNHCEKSMMIIMGCDNMYWVVTMRAGENLIKAGYEAI